MKLQSVSAIFVLGLMGLAGMADSLCLVRNVTKPTQYCYQCIRSIDYLADLEKSPIDVNVHTVSNSKIQVIRNGSYTRLGKNLQSLAVIYCGVEEIEDNAFQGLSKLRMVSLVGNKLEIIKSAWFKGLSSLKMASFQSNRIKHVEENFFSILPPLEVLDIFNNKLTCLPTDSFGNFQADEFRFMHNPLTWTCRVSLFEWLKNTGTLKDYHYSDNLDPPYEIARICENKLSGSPVDEEGMKKCVEETARELLPAEKYYTVEQACEFLKGKNSPFLDCTK